MITKSLDKVASRAPHENQPPPLVPGSFTVSLALDKNQRLQKRASRDVCSYRGLNDRVNESCLNAKSPKLTAKMMNGRRGRIFQLICWTFFCCPGHVFSVRTYKKENGRTQAVYVRARDSRHSTGAKSGAVYRRNHHPGKAINQKLMNIFTLSFFWGGAFTQSLVWINLKVTRTVRGPKGNDWKRDLLIFQPLIIYLLDTCHDLTDGRG